MPNKISRIIMDMEKVYPGYGDHWATRAPIGYRRNNDAIETSDVRDMNIMRRTSRDSITRNVLIDDLRDRSA